MKFQTSGSHVSQAILTAAQPFYHSPGVSPQEFQPDRPIGYGAFGVVWSVTDPRSGKRVALKKMPNVFQNLASCKRVFREIRMLSSFKHDNVSSPFIFSLAIYINIHLFHRKLVHFFPICVSIWSLSS
ncbi:unnamed protein product [Anisakis simplex]|uniref:Serine/threonine kinase NLK (inferred by orthology to a C. elegans protein) n=1 Tax=Anisakis simplex TaxID=6269 RepID=A0A0M3J5V1_ANISI|nr:unnamed protein product [Anisakis simplex]